MARSNLRLVDGDGFTDWIETATAQLQARRTAPAVPARPKSDHRSLPDVNLALEMVTAAVSQAKAQEITIQQLSEELSAVDDREAALRAELKQAAIARAAAEENEGRLVVLLEKAVATLADAKGQLAAANARADEAEHDLSELRRLIGFPPHR